jgi:uncharacterized alpha-E superfamily protein
MSVNTPLDSALGAIEATREHLKPYWTCLQHVDDDIECMKEEEEDDDAKEDAEAEEEAEADTASGKTSHRASRDDEFHVLNAKVETAVARDPWLHHDIRAKLKEKRTQRYQAYAPYHKK